MRRIKRPPADAGARRWKLVALASFGTLAVGVAVPQATAHDTNGLAHAVEHVLEDLGVLQGKADAIEAKTDAIASNTDNLPSSPSGRSDTGTIITDTFQEPVPGGTSLKAWNRNVEGTVGNQFLANITAHCSFVQPLNNTVPNTARVFVRSAVPTGAAPFSTRFEEKSTDHVVTVVTGPVVGFRAANLPGTYVVQCSTGGDNSVSQGMAQAWLQVDDG